MFSEKEKELANDPKAGPYMSADYFRWWFPVDFWSWNLAQAEAKDLADDSDARAKYVGVELVAIHNHEDWEESDEFCPEGGCPTVKAYTFEWVDKWGP